MAVKQNMMQLNQNSMSSDDFFIRIIQGIPEVLPPEPIYKSNAEPCSNQKGKPFTGRQETCRQECAPIF
jgi:hypothetical protein